MAVKKIRPFEEKKEKGFRDTIILYSVLRHAQIHHTGGPVLLVAGDLVFDHADVKALAEEHGVDLKRAESFADASQRITRAVKGLYGQYLSDVRARQRTFLLDEIDKILQFVKSESTVEESHLSTGIIGQIQSVEEIAVSDITVDQPGLLPSDRTEGRVEISFTVRLDIRLSVFEYGFAAPQPIQLREGPVPSPTSLPPPATPGTRNVHMDVNVEGSLVALRSDGAQQYSALELTKASVKPRPMGLGALLSGGPFSALFTPPPPEQ